ncbi:MAG: FAD-dependent oxidoreductase [Actinobacteria bacterium]|nr:FAD-dependent oxidoreductase [Actinomycetota bacterium]
MIILGAGPAGVGAAYRAARSGHDVTVLERADRVGGAAGSFEVDGVRVDHGSHRLHASIEPAILDTLRGLLGEDLQRRPRRGRIRLAERWLAFPLTPGDALRNLPPGFAVRTALEAGTAWARSARSDTFSERLRASLGPTMCERFYFPYARKLWGVEPDRLSGEQARRRVSADTPGKLIRRVVAGRDPERRTFLYPRRGYGQLWEALAEAAAADGAEIRLGTSAEAVEIDGDGVTVSTTDGDVQGNAVWSTIPMPALAGMLRPAPPPVVLAAAARLRSRAMVLVYLTLPMAQYTPFDAHYLPEEWTPVTRISEPMNYRDARGHGDPSDRTVLCAEIPCDAGDDLWTSSDDDLAAVVIDALTRAGLARPDPSAITTVRLPSAYPIYEVGWEDAFEPLDAWLERQPRILTFGRQGLFAHDNAHHALAMAWAAADALLLDGRVDHGVWERARARFRDHIVED